MHFAVLQHVTWRSVRKIPLVIASCMANWKEISIRTIITLDSFASRSYRKQILNGLIFRIRSQPVCGRQQITTSRETTKMVAGCRINSGVVSKRRWNLSTFTGKLSVHFFVSKWADHFTFESKGKSFEIYPESIILFLVSSFPFRTIDTKRHCDFSTFWLSLSIRSDLHET